MKVTTGSVFLAAFSLVACGLAQAGDLTLVLDGQPNATLIVAAGEPMAAQAAKEIQKYIEKMSGAKLPILKEGEGAGGEGQVEILVGHTAAAQKLGVKIPAGFKMVVGDPNVFEEEGFVIKTVGKSLVIGGNSDGPYHGTLYAAYEFLERIGCRWYFPGEWGEVVPEQKTVSFPETDVTSRPDFAQRENNLGGWVPSSRQEQAAFADWECKIKYTPNTTLYPMVGDGSLANLIPPNEFFSKEPELYAMNQQGSRKPEEVSPGKFYNNITMLALGNPRTLEVAVQNIKDSYAGKRNGMGRPDGFGISPPDGSPFDFDPKYKDLNQNFNYPTYIEKPQNSEEYFGFAAKIAREFPDKWISVMAYAGREMPPQGVKLPPNVDVLYAPISSCVLHAGNNTACWRRTETMKILKKWCELTPHVWMYDYNPGLLIGSFVPERDVANFAINAKLYKELKMKGFESEGRKAFMQTWISYYMRGKLMWDVNADVEALKKDFYNTFFGPDAGPLVQQWWDGCEQALGAATIHCHEDWLLNNVYTVAFTTKLHTRVEQAGKCAMTPKQKERYDAFALIADHLEAFAAKEEAEKNLDFLEASRQAERMETDKAKLTAIYSFFMGPKFTPEFSNGQAVKYVKLAQMTKFSDANRERIAALSPKAPDWAVSWAAKSDGEGTLVAPVPLEAKFQRDRFNEGVLAEWYLPGFDDSKWGTENTFLTWDAQDKPEDEKGHDYDGYGWYRFTVNVPADAVNKPLKLHLGGVINEGWVWINGNYAGHRPWLLWWCGRDALEMNVDATGKVKAGDNVITVRVWNNAEIGGLLRRGFLWAPRQ